RTREAARRAFFHGAVQLDPTLVCPAAFPPRPPKVPLLQSAPKWLSSAPEKGSRPYGRTGVVVLMSFASRMVSLLSAVLMSSAAFADMPAAATTQDPESSASGERLTIAQPHRFSREEARA